MCGRTLGLVSQMAGWQEHSAISSHGPRVEAGPVEANFPPHVSVLSASPKAEKETRLALTGSERLSVQSETGPPGAVCHSTAGGRGVAERAGGCEYRLSSQAVRVQILCYASFSSTYNRESSKRKILDWVVRR